MAVLLSKIWFAVYIQQPTSLICLCHLQDNLFKVLALVLVLVLVPLRVLRVCLPNLILLAIDNMCLNPIKIKNPNFCSQSWCSTFGELVAIPKELRPSSLYIEAPCGKCADCRSVYYNSLLQRALVESRSSYMYFVTLTYDNDHIPSVVLPNGEVIYFSDYRDVQNLFKRVRNLNILDREFRYLCATEYGDKSSRPHIHLLIFVSRLSSDDKMTPYNIERTLFTNLGKYFALNVGTRKNPVYEPLFTYKVKYTSQGIKTNYFVKYVEPPVDYDYTLNDVTSTYVKTIRYLIGYVNKSSGFDEVVKTYLDYYDYDRVLKQKLSNLLRSKVRYSKGFGCGFINGQKHYLSRISATASYQHLTYSLYLDNLPTTFAEFAELYPVEVENLNLYIVRDHYKDFDCLENYLHQASFQEFHYHCLLLRYFPNYFNTIYHRYYRDVCKPVISYYFRYVKERYQYKKARVFTTSSIDDSDTFRYLRKMVDDSINAGVPFIGFAINGGFTSMCRFYRDRVTTFDDIIKMYERNNFRNYEEWLSSFIRQKDTRKSSISASNLLLHENTDKIICNSQKKCLNLRRRIEGTDLYRSLFV